MSMQTAGHPVEPTDASDLMATPDTARDLRRRMKLTSLWRGRAGTLGWTE